MGYFIRSLGYRIQKHLFPKTMEASRELSQLDLTKSNKELISLQQKQIQIENQYLNKADINNEELSQIKTMFAQYAIKSYEQQEKIYNGLIKVESNLKVINDSIINSTNQIIDSFERLQTDLIELVKNPKMTNADELRKIGKQRFGAVITPSIYNEDDLKDAIEFYEKSIDDFVGKTNPLSWLELAHAYSYSEKYDLAKKAYLNADRLSNQGEGKILYELRNEALFNIVLIELSNENYMEAFKYVNRIIDSKVRYDNSILLLKGIIELKLEQKEKSIDSISNALNLRPELIRDIYSYSAEGEIIDTETRDSLITEICQRKRDELESKYQSINALILECSKVTSEFTNEEFEVQKKNLSTIRYKSNEVSKRDYLSIYNLVDELCTTMNKCIVHLKSALSDAIRKNDNFQRRAKNNVDGFFGYGNSTIDNRVHETLTSMRNDFDNATGWVAVIGFIILMFLLNNAWYWRILTGIGILLGLFHIVAKPIFNNQYKEHFATNKVRLNREYEIAKSELEAFNEERNNLDDLNRKLEQFVI